MHYGYFCTYFLYFQLHFVVVRKYCDTLQTLDTLSHIKLKHGMVEFVDITSVILYLVFVNIFPFSCALVLLSFQVLGVFF